MAVHYLGDNGPDGTCMGLSGEKVSFLGATPVSVQSAPSAVATTPATSSSPFGFAEAQANAIVTAVNSIRTALVNYGLIA